MDKVTYRIIESPKDASEYAVLVVEITDKNGMVHKAYKNSEEFKRFELEQKLLALGYNGNLLEEYATICYGLGYDEGCNI